jgi:F-type H+-transporting ATPase subunit b
MRIRTLLAGAVLTGATLVVVAGPAAAEPKGHAEEECIELLEEGGAIDDCQEAPSPITPATNELIWGSISFVVLFFLLWKFAYPGLKKGMDDRAERIRQSIDDAESAKAEAQTVLDEYKAQLADARNESARIIEESRQQADALKRDQEARLQAELGEVRQRAQAEIEAAKAQALADLRADVGEIAIGAAEVIVQHNLDRDTQVQLIENYINQVASSR